MVGEADPSASLRDDNKGELRDDDSASLRDDKVLVDDEAEKAASLSAICVAKTRARRTMAAAASGRRLGSVGLDLVG